MSAAKDFVRYALAREAIKIIPGGMKLVSGRISPYYFNSGPFDKGASIRELAKACAAIAQDMQTDVLFGPPMKGIPLAVATAYELYERHDINVGYAFNRPKAKDHGDQGLILGHPLKGKRVCIIDNVITTGGTLDETAQLVHNEGGILAGVIIAFDRQERVTDGAKSASATQDFEARHGVPVRAAATCDDLIAVLGDIAEGFGPNEEKEWGRNALALVLEYKKKYGAV
ncbi:MAG: orotate phosphoribosyltransferase [Parcubacteria group bacterium]|nr:orotate phosphoribosyltransferase [Parcubacteria group bacterium]